MRNKMHLLSLSVCLLACVAVEANFLEVVVTKFEALEFKEIKNLEKMPYQFSFCLCQRESKQPDRDAACDCQLNVSGKTAESSCPKALYSTSCLHSPEPGRCLFARLVRQNQAPFLYTKVDIGGRTLTEPAWQSLPSSKKKNTANLAAKTRKRLIKLHYIVFEQVGITSGQNEARRSPVQRVESPVSVRKKTIKTPSVNARTRAQSRATKGTATTRRLTAPAPPAEPIGARAPDLESLRVQSLADAQRALLTIGKRQRVQPLAFDVAGFRKAMVAVHNRFRYMHEAGPLTYDNSAEAAAQSWANALSQRSGCLVHENRKGFGENLFYFAADYFTDPMSMAEIVMRTFYAEGKGYDYSRFKRNFHTVGHFTQMIWRASQKMGVGVAIRRFAGRRSNACQPRRATYTMFIVVKYTPAGNVQSQPVYLENVRPMRRRL